MTFKYNDKVEIIRGFYRGLKGRVIQKGDIHKYIKSDAYEVDLDVTPSLKVWIENEDLRTLPC